MTGAAITRSSAASDWNAGSTRGRLTSTLTGVLPYLSWSNDVTSVSAMAGIGRGQARNLRTATGRLGTSALDLRLGLVELRRRLCADCDGLEIALRGDSSWAELRTGPGAESIDAQVAAVHQVRFGAELTRRPQSEGKRSLSPFGEVHVRYDGGAGQNGYGLEVAAGLRAAIGLLRIDFQGRMLALHSASGYREKGASLALGLGQPGSEGLSVSLASRWGAQATGGALWQDHPVFRRHGIGAGVGDWSLEARGEYGFRLRGGRILTLFGTYDPSRQSRGIQFGGRLGLGGAIGDLRGRLPQRP